MKTKIIDIGIPESQLILLMRIKRNAFFLVKLRDRRPYEVQVNQPESFNFYPVSDIEITQTDGKLLQVMHITKYGEMAFKVCNGEFGGTCEPLSRAGFKSYVLSKLEVQEELEENLEEPCEIRYNISSELPLVGSPKTQATGKKKSMK